MAGKINILFVCGAGLGSSFAAQMAAEDVLNKYQIDARLDHVDISTAASVGPDIIITAQNFEKQFAKFSIDESKTSLVFLKNIVSSKEIEEKLIPVLKSRNFI
ncbi:PTS sugar transporter subunit IIB [Streptococcus uberis]|uniref:PTS sugar transporter subunit IIB n=1 Tax=Streptococcus uberis TaxID=1349 RepID=UPI0005438200|nr:PTS sugar transporter subunit IIB [Streptococcus uberis]KHD40288.1 PTS ascorbate transporter subunit IIB [Streptococcus hongkongensis]KKF61050.1 PTS ascorbate transporter subunit IIB [Streptococcus uberis B362]MCK1169550.1 PTS sugar transporter subunit IIB [Streptococcus uberis]MCK1197079.1 PTS sugar transporter subunit IIB [Streptococcus uberis]MCK1198872.1 PTS sugar transporter subunit IIB [Streptococcus uberis]